MAARSPAIHWFRRDLRISDNPALHAACRAADSAIPVYVLSTWRGNHSWTGPARQEFLCEALRSLAGNLRTVGGELVIRSGDAVEKLLELADQTGAGAIFFNRDPDPFGKGTEARLERACVKRGLECRGFDDVTLHRPDEVLTKTGSPYKVYTPYSRAWLELEKPVPLPKPRDLATPGGIASDPLPDLGRWGLANPPSEILAGGEREALQRLNRAISERLPGYHENRDAPAIDGTSRLSQDLRFGLISPRTVYARVEKARTGAGSSQVNAGFATFIKELAWREFYMAILHHFPSVLEEEFSPDWRGLPWDEPGESFEWWQEGRTGFPIVDAGMRQLRATGFMHNRVRMITAMFLTKDLHLDWRLGEQYFMKHLVDGEIASNNGGWQWSAGTGADAAPYFRIQNPWTQGARHDPQATYIKRWLPELEHVPAAKLHKPPETPRPIADDYPLPCVDHKTEREKTLSLFKRHRQR